MCINNWSDEQTAPASIISALPVINSSQAIFIAYNDEAQAASRSKLVPFKPMTFLTNSDTSPSIGLLLGMSSVVAGILKLSSFNNVFIPFSSVSVYTGARILCEDLVGNDKFPKITPQFSNACVFSQ